MIAASPAAMYNPGHRAGAAKSPHLNSSKDEKQERQYGAVEPGMNSAPSELGDRHDEAGEQSAHEIPVPPSTTTTKAIGQDVPMFGTI